MISLFYTPFGAYLIGLLMGYLIWGQRMGERVFVFTEAERSMKERWASRPFMYAFRESEIKDIRTQRGSQNCYLVVNNLEVNGSFDDLVNLLGERIDIK